MAYSFGKNSLKHRATCHPLLQKVLDKAAEFYNFSVVAGMRGEAEQNDAFARGVSKLKFPESMHNNNPSLAFDVYPWHPVYGSLTEDSSVVYSVGKISGRGESAARYFIREEYCMMAQAIKDAATSVGVELRWGGDWDRDFDRLDQSFNDLAHFELTGASLKEAQS